MANTQMDDRIYKIPNQIVDLIGFKCEGRILDIGGGGEGIIGQVLGENVVSIDPEPQELAEAPDGPLKIVMDACNMLFLDKTFDYVTSFFTLMYVDRNHRRKLYEEVYRVLKPGGEFILWDVVVPEVKEEGKDIFLVPVKVKVGTEKGLIYTGYGVMWEGHQQDLDYCVDLAKTVGFEIIKRYTEGQVFHLRLIKP